MTLGSNDTDIGDTNCLFVLYPIDLKVGYSAYLLSTGLGNSEAAARKLNRLVSYDVYVACGRKGLKHSRFAYKLAFVEPAVGLKVKDEAA